MHGRGGLSGAVSFPFSQSIAAGATFNPLTDWQYETPMQDVDVELIERATAIGLVSAVTSGGDTIKQESPVQAGGTAGTLPARLTTDPVTGHGHAAQKVRVSYRNPTGGAITVDGVLRLIPKGGSLHSAMGGFSTSGVRRSSPRRAGRGFPKGLAILRRRR